MHEDGTFGYDAAMESNLSMHKAKQTKVLLITPPMVQLNTPYPATPVLTGFLKENGVDAVQFDMSLAVALRLFTREGVKTAIEFADEREDPSPQLMAFLENAELYASLVDGVMRFLQGRDPEMAWLICRRGFLPEGLHFRELDPSDEELDEENLQAYFGSLGIQDKAKMLASLFLDDLADAFKEAVDPGFGFAKYAEHLAVSAPSFDPFYTRLISDEPTVVDTLIDELTRQLLDEHKPDFVGLTVPFPGTVYAAFRVAACVRRHAPDVKLVLGGGYVNSELRDMTDKRVFDFFDYVSFDEGFNPWLGIIGKAELQSVMTCDGFIPAKASTSGKYKVPVSDYTGLDMTRYLSMLETANPMHRLWSDGRWLKVQLSSGCYWHKCAFCDVSLDYIQCFAPPDPTQAVDALVQMMTETGIRAFHFTDEALAPALLNAMCDEITRRGVMMTWWGNIRLDATFNDALIVKMWNAGCIGISAGLECANDRLLKLMNKGITLKTATRVCESFSENGMMVHVYLMYGFPTQTYAETVGALEFVRSLYEEGFIQSSFWHRFALTVHSPIAKNPAEFGIELLPQDATDARFALNEIPFYERGAPDLDRIGKALHVANYNLTRGAGLSVSADYWFDLDGRDLS